jgi:hypothetical protein
MRSLGLHAVAHLGAKIAFQTALMREASTFFRDGAGMIFVMMAAALASGALTAAALWPTLGIFALLAAPVGASLSALVVAAAIALWPGKTAADAAAEMPLEGIADQLVAELRSLAEASPHVPRVAPARKAG